MSDFSLANIKLCVGLGNIGKEYSRTRHNAGFLFIDQFVAQLNPDATWQNDSKFKCELINIAADNGKLILIKPTTMMNLSGEAVQAVAHYFQIQPDEILVAHDDLDIPLGKYKIQLSTGPKQHNGLLDVDSKLGTEDYWRLRIGVENREVKGNKQISGVDYSLERFSLAELEVLSTTISEIINSIL